MIPLICALLFSVVGIKVYKKSSPNGKLTVYLGKRDVVDRCDGVVDPIEGVILIDNKYLEHRRVFGEVVTTFRYGREEDEVMGLKFSKTLTLSKDQIVPAPNTKNPSSPTPLQERLLRKLGNTPNVYPFLFYLPLSAPPSVTLQPSNSDTGRPLGTEYELKTYIGESDGDPGHKRSTVSFRIRKVQWAGLERGKKQPSSLITKGFKLSPGKLTVEVSLDRDIYYHGEEIGAHVAVTNTCKKSVKNIKVMVMQHCEVTMVNAQFSRAVAHLESREGCPITPGTSLTKVFRLSPCAASNKDRRGIALDGHFQDEDVNLASSTLTPANSTDNSVGFVVSYSLRVKVNCGTLGGDVTADLPFKLVHPGLQSTAEPDGEGETRSMKKLTKEKSRDVGNYQSLCYSKDGDDDEGNIIFEDFAKLRMSMSDIDN